jgi:3'(2'), 5'-bisphosphate nucleotidase
MNDHELARDLAATAGSLLMDVRQKLASATPARRGAEGDRRSHEFLIRRLREERPSDAVLSEESLDNLQRLRSSRVWIIDPLDGTREFGELERNDWAVHVALWDSGRLAAGAVALPAQGLTLSTPDMRLAEVSPRRTRIMVSRTRPPRVAEEAARSFGAELVPLGSAGAKVAAIIRGEADVYIHAGGQHEWDSAAPVAVALCAGLHASRLDGSPLVYNQPDPSLPDLLVCRPELARLVLATLREVAR